MDIGKISSEKGCPALAQVAQGSGEVTSLRGSTACACGTWDGVRGGPGSAGAWLDLGSSEAFPTSAVLCL